MPDTPTFAEEMVTKLEATLRANAGVDSVNVDGVMVKYLKLREEYEHWKRQVAIASSTRPLVAQIDMSGGV